MTRPALAPFIVPSDTVTGLPRPILERIAKGLRVNSSGPGVEQRLISVLGEDPLEWNDVVARKFKNPVLAEFIYSCFRPVIPKDVTGLGSEMILHALKVYERVPRMSFVFYGPYPAGYQFRPKRIDTTKKRLGFVINTSGGSGSHWIALFAEVATKRFDYFDSLGCEPNPLVKSTITSIVGAVKRFHPEMDTRVYYTRTAKQGGSTECGVYVVWFLVSRMYGASLEDVKKTDLPDKECTKLRYFFWNPR